MCDRRHAAAGDDLTATPLNFVNSVNLSKIWDSFKKGRALKRSLYDLVDSSVDSRAAGDLGAAMTAIVDDGARCKMGGKASTGEAGNSVEESEEKIAPTVENFRLLTEDSAVQCIKPPQNILRKSVELLRIAERDSSLVDLKISMYIASINGSNLKPYPDHVVDESSEGMQGLLMINDLIPSVEILKLSLRKGDSVQLNEQVINLVHWLIVQLRQPKLVEVPREDFDTIFGRIEAAVNLKTPTRVFKIMVNNLSSNQLQWQAAKGGQRTKFAFCDVQATHVHSLLHLGLYPFRKTHGPKGLGIYLTSDLKNCLENSPPAWVWGKSVIGTRVQTAAIVEFIPLESKILRYRDTSYPEAEKPYHYFVQHNNLIQARYLLVYVKDTHKLDNPALKYFSKRKENQMLWRRIALIASYLAICFASWKTFKGSPSSNFLHYITEKLYKSPHFRSFLPFVESQALP